MEGLVDGSGKTNIGFLGKISGQPNVEVTKRAQVFESLRGRVGLEAKEQGESSEGDSKPWGEGGKGKISEQPKAEATKRAQVLAHLRCGDVRLRRPRGAVLAMRGGGRGGRRAC